MLTPPRDADEAFVRLAPDLQEIADFIGRITNLLSYPLPHRFRPSPKRQGFAFAEEGNKRLDHAW